MKIENAIKDAISLNYNESPQVSVVEMGVNAIINVNFDTVGFRIDKTFESNTSAVERAKGGPKKQLTQIFLGIPARDIHYEDLKEMFTIIFKAYHGFKTRQKYEKLKQKDSDATSAKQKTNQKTNKNTIHKIIRCP